MNDHNYVAIMAGGIGSRFWPSSTEQNPKQFLDILGTGKSLLRISFERFLKFIPVEHIYVVTHIRYKHKIREHIPELKAKQIICEPSRNNTAPGVAYAAFRINGIDPKARLIMAPSDHVILKEDLFIDKIKFALQFAENGKSLITLGILPNRPDTGYGYIKYDKSALNQSPDNKESQNRSHSIHAVLEFREKPDLATAKKYLASGNYLWNAGIFIWKTKTVLEAFKEHASTIYNLLEPGIDLYNTEREEAFINEYFPQTPNISVDYAIMEKANNILTIPADISWSDLGTWNALYAFLPKDKNGNVIFSEKNIVINSENNLVKTDKNKIIVIKEVQDLIIIEEDDVLMICPRNKEQEIKQIRESVTNRFKN